MPRTKKSTQRRATFLSQRVEQIGNTATLLTHARLLEVCRRDEETAEVDGYPSRSPGSGDGGHGGSDSTATESAVIRRIDYRNTDQIHQDVERVAECLREATKLLREADRLSAVVLNAADKHRGRETSLQEPCIVDACVNVPAGVGADRRKRGLCPPCFGAFELWKVDNPDVGRDPGAHFRRFMDWRNEALSESEEQEWRIDVISEHQENGVLPKGRVTA